MTQLTLVPDFIPEIGATEVANSLLRLFVEMGGAQVGGVVGVDQPISRT